MGHILYHLYPHHLRLLQDFELDDNMTYSSPLHLRNHNGNGSAASRDTL